MKLMWQLYAYGFVKLTRKHITPREAMCAWCGEAVETQTHITRCGDKRMADLREQTFAKVIDIIVPHLKTDTAKVWIAEAVPTIIAGGPINISRTIDVRLNKMIEDLQGWHHNDMWKGVVPQKLVDLLASLGMRKREIGTTAREITNLLETRPWIYGH